MPPPDPRREIWLSGDESGSFGFSGRESDRYFLIVTVGVECESLRTELDMLSRRLRRAMGNATVTEVFHAKDDAPLVRDQVFDLIASHKLYIDATIIDKASIPADLKRGHVLYTFLWHQHIIHVLSGMLSPNNKVHLQIARFGAYSRNESLDSAIHQAMAVTYAPLVREATSDSRLAGMVEQIYALPALEYHYVEAEQDRLVQVADYCAWAIQRKLRTNEDRYYSKILPSVRSKRFLSISKSARKHQRNEKRTIGLGEWTGLRGDVYDYDVSSVYEVGPADPFQTLNAMQESLRAGDFHKAVDYLERIDPSDVTDLWLYQYEPFLQWLAEDARRDLGLALKTIATLARVAWYLFRRDEGSRLYQYFLAEELYNYAFTLDRAGCAVGPTCIYDLIVNLFQNTDVDLVLGIVIRSIVNKGFILCRINRNEEGIRLLHQAWQARSVLPDRGAVIERGLRQLGQNL